MSFLDVAYKARQELADVLGVKSNSSAFQSFLTSLNRKDRILIKAILFYLSSKSKAEREVMMDTRAMQLLNDMWQDHLEITILETQGEVSKGKPLLP